jgi:hypothetical protein
MANYTSPGVYVQEGPLLTLAPRSSGLSVAAFFGEAQRGPTTPVLIEDWASFRRLYGNLDPSFDLGYAVYHYFTNGGRAAWVTRVVGDAAAPAEAVSIPYFPNGTSAASSSLFTVTAAGKGAWGNDLSVEVVLGNIPPSADELPTFSIIVRYRGQEVERWLELSTDSGRNRFAPLLVNRSSSYVRLSAASTAPPSAECLFPTVVTQLTGGVDSTPANSDYIASFNLIDSVSDSLLLNAVGKTDQDIVQSLLNKAASRGDSFVIIDPSASDEDRADVEATVASYVGIANASYGAVYAPMLRMVDPTKSGVGAIRTTFPGGAVAGLYARTEVERTVAKAPAGFTSDIRGAFGTVFQVTESDVNALYSGSPPVNLFRAVPGGGIIVNGARTLTKRDPDIYINVRRTLNYLKRNLKELSQFAVFENNDYIVWTALSSTITGFLTNFWQAGGLKGRTAGEAFRVVCDETNNNPALVEQGVVNVEVAVALLYPAEFIVIQLSQWAGGSTVTESI